MHNFNASLGMSARLREDMGELKIAMKEAERKLRLLDEIRNLLEECGDDSGMTQLFASLLEEAGELHEEAKRISSDLSILQESLEDALWMTGNPFAPTCEGVFS